MITIFNRAELLMTYNLSEQVRVRNILSDNNIEYITKTHCPTSGSNRRSSFALNMDYLYEYRIYVRKKDLDYALHLIHSSK